VYGGNAKHKTSPVGRVSVQLRADLYGGDLLERFGRGMRFGQ
jgi:hypothetical protein